MKIIIGTDLTSTPFDYNHKVPQRVDNFSKLYLNGYFRDKNFGADVLVIDINIQILMKEYLDFEKIGRPKYYDSYKLPTDICKSNEGKIWYKEYHIDSRFSQDDIERLLVADDNEIDLIIARHVYKTLDLLDKLPKRVKDFDRAAFMKDVETLFRYHGWL